MTDSFKFLCRHYLCKVRPIDYSQMLELIACNWCKDDHCPLPEKHVSLDLYHIIFFYHVWPYNLMVR